jgi:hypothetical protein
VIEGKDSDNDDSDGDSSFHRKAIQGLETCRWDPNSCSMKSAPDVKARPNNRTSSSPARRRVTPRRMNTFSGDTVTHGLSCSQHGLSSLPRSMSKNSSLCYRKQSLSRKDILSQASNSARTIKTETSCCSSSSKRLATRASSVATPPRKPKRNNSYGSGVLMESLELVGRS